jgi:polyhydroxybutyrate depolymerase
MVEFDNVRRGAMISVASFSLLSLFLMASAAQQFRGEAIEHSVAIDGLNRKYLVFAPKVFDQPLPVVLALHVGGSNARQMERYNRFNALAANEGFLVVYSEAFHGNWSDGRGIQAVRAHQENIDDGKFMKMIVDRLSQTHKIDRFKIYCTGISNGAFMAHRREVEASYLIAAIAPVVGGMAPAMAKKFNPKFPVSTMIIQRDADPLVPIRGGMVGFPRGEEAWASHTDG